MKVAYLSDMFQKLNELNLHMQGIKTHLPHRADKITSFTRKLGMWEQWVKYGNIDSFENLKSLIEVNKLQNTIIPNLTGFETPSEQHRLWISALQRRKSSLILIQQWGCSLV